MKRSCQYCGGIHPVGVDCPMRPKRKAKEYTEIVRFRSSWAWTRKAKQIKERDHYLCRLCLEEGRMCTKDLEVHHIEPICENWDARLENDNLVTLCDKCHELAECGAVERARLKAMAAGEAVSPRGRGG